MSMLKTQTSCINHKRGEIFTVDVTATKAENIFFRSQLIENIDDESDNRHSTSIARETEDVSNFVAGQSLIDITLRLDSYQDYTVI